MFRSPRVLLIIVLVFTLLFAVGMMATVGGQDSVLEIQDVSISDADAGEDRTAHEIVFTAQTHGEEGSQSISIDTSELPDEVSIEDVSVDTRWHGEISSTSQDSTVVDIRWHAHGETGDIVVTFDLDTSAVNYAALAYGYESTGFSGSTNFQIGTEPEDGVTGAEPTALDEGEALVYVEVLGPGGERLGSDEIDAWARKGISTYHGGVTGDGTIALQVDAGTYDLIADADGYAHSAVSDVEIREGVHDEPYVIRVEHGGTLEGTITDGNGVPVPDASVEIEDSSGVVVLAHTDSNGAYSIELAPDVYTVRAWDDTRVSDDVHILTIDSSDASESLDFELRAPEVLDATIDHVGGTEPDMDALDVQIVEQGGLVFAEVGSEDVGVTAEEAFAPQDLSEYGVDETTVFELTITVERFSPDSLIAAAGDATWDVESTGEETVEITVRTAPADLELIDDVYRGPVTDNDEIRWPSGDDDAADASAQVVQLAFLETPGLNPAEQRSLRGMSVATNAQVFGFPRVKGGELSIYLGAPGERVDGTTHEGYYHVFLPDSLLDEWDVEDPESDLEAMWQGGDESFVVDDADGGVYVTIDPIEYSDGTVVIRSTTYEQGVLDRLPSWWQIQLVAGELWVAARMQWAILGLKIGGLRYGLPVAAVALAVVLSTVIIRRRT